MMGGINARTAERLRWHAGFSVSLEDGSPSISTCTLPGRSSDVKQMEAAISDLLATLAKLNLELNGAVPSLTDGGQADVPRDVAYAVTEIIRLLRNRADESGDTAASKVVARTAWIAEVAWSAVLAGDIDDLKRHVNQETTARGR
jgi:hypothetical protein